MVIDFKVGGSTLVEKVREHIENLHVALASRDAEITELNLLVAEITHAADCTCSKCDDPDLAFSDE